MSPVLASLVTFVLTTVFAMAGVGAAFVLIPVFLLFGVELHTAMATALLLNAIAMTVASATFIRKGLVEWRLVLPMLLLAVLASPIGVHVAQGLDRTLLLWLFVAFLLFATVMILFYRPKSHDAHTSIREALILGLPVGALAGFVAACWVWAAVISSFQPWWPPVWSQNALRRALPSWCCLHRWPDFWLM